MGVELFRATYDCDAPPRVVESKLVRRGGFEPIERDGTRHWIVDHEWGLYRDRASYDPRAGEITITRTVHIGLRLTLIALIGLLVAGIALDRRLVVNGTFILAAILTLVLHDDSVPPTLEPATLRSYRLAPDYFASFGTVIAAAIASPDVGTGFTAGLYLVIGGLLAFHYAQGATFPLSRPVDPADTPTQLQIALLGFALPIVVVLLLAVFAATWAALPGIVALPVSIAFCGLGTVYFGTACAFQVSRLERSQFAEFPTNAIRVALVLAYLGLNLVLVRVLLWGSNLVGIALADIVFVRRYAPGGASLELVGIIREQVGVSVGIAGTVIDPATAAVVGLPFLPVFVVFGCWCVFLLVRLRTGIRLTIASEASDWTAPDGETVPVRVIDDEQLHASVHGRLFGIRPLIVVSSAVMKLNESERDAVLSHELYHVRNHDPVVNAVATLTSLFLFGGRNAFLVFYDYPRIEREADRFAADVTSVQDVSDALERFRRQRARSKVAGNRRSGGLGPYLTTPDTGAGLNPNRWLERLSVGTRLRTWLDDTAHDLGAIYRLFYGDVLLSNAHGSVEERIARLENGDGT